MLSALLDTTMIFSPLKIFLSHIFFLAFSLVHVILCARAPSSILSSQNLANIYILGSKKKKTVECGERESQSELCVRLLLYTNSYLSRTNLEHIHS